jgi:Mlc titration factor MtfA (ptsG expression regulator)
MMICSCRLGDIDKTVFSETPKTNNLKAQTLPCSDSWQRQTTNLPVLIPFVEKKRKVLHRRLSLLFSDKEALG